MASPSTDLLIDGERVEGAGAPLAVENPATEETVAIVGSASEEQVRAATAAAVRGQEAWSRIAAAERAELLHEIAAGLRARTDEFAALMTSEGGKPLVENADEVGWTASAFSFYAELARTQIGRVIPPVETHQLAMVVKEPLGVVGAIVPWNYPLLLLAWKLAPALAAGNAVVCKPSELTPLSTLALAPLFHALPPGTVQLLAGAGEVGSALVQDPRVDGIAFTGSTETGKAIARAAIDRMARVNLEMGGKDALIVCPDVSGEALQIAAEGAAWASFLNAGQVCTSTERIYVHASRYDEFVAAFVAYTGTLRIGDPTQPTTDVGPMVSAAQRAKAAAHVEAAVAAGAELLIGGDRAGHERGHFLSPAVLTGVPAEAAVLRAETFGPVAPIVRVGSVDEAVALANGSQYGLGVNVYTTDLETSIGLSRRLKAGTVWINDPLTDNDAGPFGGFKQSGLGRELGPEGLEAFQETKHVHLDPRIERKDWWYPYGR
ncbi:MAG: aldehyde dehydrogenase family protein [Solirubrobacteraceae bacterium]|nr:aldehyde dehydrogenase family protein [Solirubrobacteraceae bacterium]